MEAALEIDPLTEFFSAIRNANTKRNYEKDLGKFFDYVKLEGSLKSKLEYSQRKPRRIISGLRIISALTFKCKRKESNERKSRNQEFTISTNPVRLFCEENDILLNWKKLGRRIPKRARAANDRAPELEEIKRILAYPDRKIKPAGKMEAVTQIDRAGRVLIPKEIRERMNLKEDSSLLISEADKKGVLILKKLDIGEMAKSLRRELKVANVEAIAKRIEVASNERMRKEQKILGH